MLQSATCVLLLPLLPPAAMHRSAAATYAGSNVRINCVAPGLVQSPASGEVSQDPELSTASAEVSCSAIDAICTPCASCTMWHTWPSVHTMFSLPLRCWKYLPVDLGLSCPLTHHDPQAKAFSVTAAS